MLKASERRQRQNVTFVMILSPMSSMELAGFAMVQGPDHGGLMSSLPSASVTIVHSRS